MFEAFGHSGFLTAMQKNHSATLRGPALAGDLVFVWFFAIFRPDLSQYWIFLSLQLFSCVPWRSMYQQGGIWLFTYCHCSAHINRVTYLFVSFYVHPFKHLALILRAITFSLTQKLPDIAYIYIIKATSCCLYYTRTYNLEFWTLDHPWQMPREAQDPKPLKKPCAECRRVSESEDIHGFCLW